MVFSSIWSGNHVTSVWVKTSLSSWPRNDGLPFIFLIAWKQKKRKQFMDCVTVSFWLNITLPLNPFICVWLMGLLGALRAPTGPVSLPNCCLGLSFNPPLSQRETPPLITTTAWLPEIPSIDQGMSLTELGTCKRLFKSNKPIPVVEILYFALKLTCNQAHLKGWDPWVPDRVDTWPGRKLQRSVNYKTSCLTCWLCVCCVFWFLLYPYFWTDSS